MEVDEGQCNKSPTISRNGGSVNNEAPKMEYGATGGVDLSGGVGRFYGWPSSRIVRVSRASGGKDRHSKVLTSKGLRDRRVRLSVNTAIQFYDLQDRLGYDQPSKAVEWLLKAAANSITELPPISPPFPDTPKQQMSDEKQSESVDNNGVVDPELDPDPNNYPPQRNVAKKSSACSSPSEISKGSGLSLSRSDGPKRARNEPLQPISQATSFTELLSGRELHSAPMDYFGGIFGTPPVMSRQVIPATSPLFSMTENHHHQPELQHFSFVPDHLVVPVAGNGGYNNGSSEYNLNFTISSSSANPLNRGTLQSNSSSPSPSLFPNGSPPGFFIGTMENHQQFLSQFYYGDSQANNNGGRYSGQEKKEKN